MSEWKEYKLGEIVTFQRGHDLPRSEMKFGIYPVAGSNSIIGYHNQFTTKAPGITIGRSGNIGNPQLHETDFWAHNTVLYVKEFKKVDPIFFYYLLKTLDFSQLNSGSAVPSLNRNFIHPFKVTIPRDLPTQQSIASILSSLDDKIELNNAINKNLEALAQALFKHWFVDFEFPNEEGLPYKSSGGEMVESELGMIPKGWRVSSLDKIAEYLNGLALQKYPPESEKESLPVIKIKELRQGNTNGSDRASIKIPEKYIVKDGDVLFAWSGSLMIDFWTNGGGALNQHLFKVSSEVFSKWFYYFWTKFHLDEFISIAESKATTMGHIQRKHLSDAKVLIPPDIQMQGFSKVFEPIIDQIVINRIEVNSLIELREALLPKLISGQLEVNEALAQIERDDVST